MPLICIDPGHGGSDSGGTGLGRKEKNDVLEISLKIRDLLTRQGVGVLMTRETDKSITIANRTKLANNAGCDYYLSVHRDAFSDASAKGSSIYVHSQARDATVKKATEIYNAVIEASGFYKRGVKKGAANYTDYGVNKQTNMPSALLELGFITNSGDNEKFVKHMDNIALAVTQALCEIVGVNYKKPRIKGDVDGDGDVDTDDARKALRNAVGLDRLTRDEKNAADMDGDGTVSTDDARNILRKATGLD